MSYAPPRRFAALILTCLVVGLGGLMLAGSAHASAIPVSGCSTATGKISDDVGYLTLGRYFCWNGQTGRLRVAAMQYSPEVSSLAGDLGGGYEGANGLVGITPQPYCSKGTVTDYAANVTYTSQCAWYVSKQEIEDKYCVGVKGFSVCHHHTFWVGFAVAPTGEAQMYVGASSSSGKWYPVREQ